MNLRNRQALDSVYTYLEGEAAREYDAVKVFDRKLARISLGHRISTAILCVLCALFVYAHLGASPFFVSISPQMMGTLALGFGIYGFLGAQERRLQALRKTSAQREAAMGDQADILLRVLTRERFPDLNSRKVI